VDSFVLFRSNESNYAGATRVKFTDQLDDTVYRISSAIFGERAWFKLRLVPAKKNIEYYPAAYSFFESQTQSLLGYQVKDPDFNSFYGRVNSDEFIFGGCDTLKRYSISQRRVVDKLGYYDPEGCNCYEYPEVSNSGKYLATYIGCNKDILFTRASDFNPYAVRKLPDITTNGWASVMAVSDSATAIFQKNDGGFMLYDLVTSELLGYYGKGKGDYEHPVKISPTGEYFFGGFDTVRLVKFKNGQFTEIRKTSPNDIQLYGFDPLHADRLVTIKRSTLSVRSCEDFSLIREINFDEEAFLDIDYFAGEILTWSIGHLYVRNFSDGSLVKDIPTALWPDLPQERCYLLNHTIVCVAGLLYFILPS
jgi:hypothetical protein